MATTESRSGFRLPWSSDNSAATETSTTGVEEGVTSGSGPEHTHAPVEEASSAGSPGHSSLPWPSDASSVQDESGGSAPAERAASGAGGQVAAAGGDSPAPASSSGTPSPAPAPRKPTRFLADLTKAMQAAAEAARSATLDQYRADGKGFIEQIHARSATEAAVIRKRADEDVATIREWSKAEIARIREEAEQRTARRKVHLETQLEQHAALIEREIEKVQARISGLEREMERFFDALLREEDPTTIATMASNLPEPEPFEAVDEAALKELLADPGILPLAAGRSPDDDRFGEGDETDIEAPQTVASEADTQASTVTQGIDGDGLTAAEVEPEPLAVAATGESTGEELIVAVMATGEPAETSSEPDVSADAAGLAAASTETVDATTAMAAIEARAQSAALDEDSATLAADETRADERVLETQDGPHATLDYASAEAQAAAAAVDQAGGGAEGEAIVEIGEESLAARLAGLVPTTTGATIPAGRPTSQPVATAVTVVGLVSVASIAGFKRQLGRLTGVHSVGVSSGPDGEFVFAVQHQPDADLRALITTLPGFQARVTESGQGTMSVTAVDPEA